MTGWPFVLALLASTSEMDLETDCSNLLTLISCALHIEFLFLSSSSGHSRRLLPSLAR